MKIQAQRLIINSIRKFINMGAITRLWNLVKNIHPSDISSIMTHLIIREKLTLFNTLYEKTKRESYRSLE